MNEDIWVEVSSLVLTLGVGGGTVIVAKNESKSKFIMLSLFKLLDSTVSEEKEGMCCHYCIINSS